MDKKRDGGKMVKIPLEIRQGALDCIDKLVKKHKKKKMTRSAIIRLAVERYIVNDAPAYFVKKG